MELLKITDRISYFPHRESPLSADVGVIRCDGRDESHPAMPKAVLGLNTEIMYS